MGFYDSLTGEYNLPINSQVFSSTTCSASLNNETKLSPILEPSKPLLLVLNHIRSGSIPSYSLYLSKVAKNISQVINCFPSPAHGRRSDDSTEYGRFPILPLNYLYPRKAFPLTYEFAKGVAEGDGMIHYSDQSFRPMFVNERTTVTFHDNPFVNFLTGLYSGDGMMSVIGRSIYRDTLKKYQDMPVALSNSKYVKNKMHEWGFEGKIVPIYLPFHPELYPMKDKSLARKQLGITTDKKLVLNVSTNDQRKNIATLLKVMESLGDDYVLVRVGPKLINSLNFDEVSYRQLNLIYNACDVLILPSLEEGFGRPMVEGFATGIPVVASKIPAFEELAEGSAELIEPLDYLGFAKKIREIVGNPGEQIAKSMARSVYFTTDRFNHEMRSYYRNYFRLRGV